VIGALVGRVLEKSPQLSPRHAQLPRRGALIATGFLEGMFHRLASERRGDERGRRSAIAGHLLHGLELQRRRWLYHRDALQHMYAVVKCESRMVTVPCVGWLFSETSCTPWFGVTGCSISISDASCPAASPYHERAGHDLSAAG
jgi:hypothetical protein